MRRRPPLLPASPTQRAGPSCPPANHKSSGALVVGRGWGLISGDSRVTALGEQSGACWKNESVLSPRLSGSQGRAGTARRGGLRPPTQLGHCSHHTLGSKTGFYGSCGGCCFPWGCCLCLCIYMQTHLVLTYVLISEVWHVFVCIGVCP